MHTAQPRVLISKFVTHNREIIGAEMCWWHDMKEIEEWEFHKYPKIQKWKFEHAEQFKSSFYWWIYDVGNFKPLMNSRICWIRWWMAIVPFKKVPSLISRSQNIHEITYLRHHLCAGFDAFAATHLKSLLKMKINHIKVNKAL